MKRNRILLVIIFILTLMDLLLLIDRASLKNDTLQNFGSFNSYDNDYIVERLNDNIKINEPLSLVSIDGDSLTGKSFRSKRKIVFRYTISSCHDCVTSEFDVIQQAIEENPSLSKKLLIITYYHNHAAMVGDLREMRNRRLNIPIFITQHLKGVPIEDENLPYYFVLENDSIIRNVFICYHDKPSRTTAYLRSAFELCNE